MKRNYSSISPNLLKNCVMQQFKFFKYCTLNWCRYMIYQNGICGAGEVVQWVKNLSSKLEDWFSDL